MKKIITVCFLLLFVANKLLAKEYYVAKNGSAKNEGTKELPFLTLQQARDAIRLAKKNDDNPEKIMVWIREGVYSFEETLKLNDHDSGEPNAPIIYQAYPNERVRFIGGKYLPVSSVQPLTNEEILSQLSEPGARAKIRMIDLKKLGITDYGKHRQFGFGLPVVNSPMELFINNRKMILARYPNKGFMKIGKVHDTGSVPRQNDYVNVRGGSFEYTDNRHEKWIGQKNIWIKGTLNRGFADDRIQVKEICQEKKRLTLATPHMYGIAGGKDFQQYYVENIFSEIDMPGEYYIDEEEGILYFIPPEDTGISEISVSILEKPIVSLINTSHVEFRNIIFEVTRGMGIYIEGGNSNRITACVIRNIGTLAVMMGQGAKQTFPHLTHDEYEGIPVSEEIGSLTMQLYNHSGWDRKAGFNHGIQCCEIYNTGTGAIVLSGGSKKQLIEGNCYVENCRIYDFQTRIATQGTAISVDGCGNKVRHNEIFNSDQQAIWVRGNNHLFEFNEIHHIALNTNDASAWYMGRDPSDQGQIIRNNFFHHIGRPDRELTMGIYFDDSACGALVEGNVFYKVASYGTIYSNAGSDLIIKNNIFIEGYGPAIQLKSRWWDRLVTRWDSWLGEGSLFRQRLLEEVDIKNPPYTIQYPDLANWLDLSEDGYSYEGMYPRRNSMKNNVIVKYRETSRLVGINANISFANNLAVNEDPGFVDAANMDFRLKKNSEVFKKIPDFENIPFENIGLIEDTDRAFIHKILND